MIAVVLGLLSGWLVIAFLFGSAIGRVLRRADQRQQPER